ncbi:hypothetical protein [Marinobacter subterrani]|uniref:hypothetical protein n=1 Tax=Marinobacter subterrani TaxID=1658765 RepID=UPI0023552421|nr:hypothetical protein [Marinobacter subterrani]
MYQTNYTRIHHPIGSDTCLIPDLLPARLQEFIMAHIDLVLAGESLRLDELADRIKQIGNNKDAAYACRLKLWMELMLFAEDCVVNFDALPMEFEYGNAVYDHTTCLSILGEAALSYLLSDQEAA